VQTTEFWNLHQEASEYRQTPSRELYWFYAPMPGLTRLPESMPATNQFAACEMGGDVGRRRSKPEWAKESWCRNEKRQPEGWRFSCNLVARGGIEPPTQGFSIRSSIALWEEQKKALEAPICPLASHLMIAETKSPEKIRGFFLFSLRESARIRTKKAPKF